MRIKPFYLAVGLLLAGCVGENNPTPAPIFSIDTLQQDSSTRSEDLSVNTTRSADLHQIFLKIPNEHWQSKPFRTLSKELKNQLAHAGQALPFVAEKQAHFWQIKEQFQNEDDEQEKSHWADLIAFRYKNKAAWLVLISEKIVRKNSPEASLIKRSCWEFDGQNWEAAEDKIPQVSLSMFFDEPIVAQHSEPIELRPKPNKPDILEAQLPFKYQNKPNSKELELRWNGERMELMSR